MGLPVTECLSEGITQLDDSKQIKIPIKQRRRVFRYITLRLVCGFFLTDSKQQNGKQTISFRNNNNKDQSAGKNKHIIMFSCVFKLM